MPSSFSKLSLAEPLARAVAEMGYESMTPIQAQAIPVVLTGKDVMGAAQTALQRRLTTLDTRIAAFALPDESRPLWTGLSSPLTLTDSLWLVINPSTVRLGMLRMQGDTLQKVLKEATSEN